MKKAKMTIVAVLVALVAVTTYSVSGTYAKYTETFTGATSKATIAKWAILLNDKEKDEQNFEFNLFNTIIDTLDGSDRTDGKTNVAANVVAPGTRGEFTIKLKNDSDVNAQFKVNVTPKDSTLPVTFKVTETDGTTEIAAGTAVDLDMGAEKSVLVKWEWPFNASGDDTQYASTTTTEKSLEVDATVIVDQVD